MDCGARVAALIGTRRVAVVGIVLVATGAAVYFYQRAGTDPAVVRSSIASAGKRACFDDARADARNVLVPDARLTAFCTCTLDAAVAAMSDEDARQAAVNAMAIGGVMRAKLAAANRDCRGRLVD